MSKSLMTLLALVTALLITLSGCGGSAAPLTDGAYTANVSLSGGTGRATVESPSALKLENGKYTARIVWSSPYYDLMTLDGIEYYPVNTAGNSAFELPVALDTDISVSARTTAMSTPHTIDYILRFDGKSLKKEEEIAGLTQTSSLRLEYADQFSVDFFDGGYALIRVVNSGDYLIVPENAVVPRVDKSVTILRRPLERIYNAASAAFCQLDALDALDNLRFSGTKASDLYIENARAAIEAGKIIYAGKYSAPDYEALVSGKCGLAIESAMINHSPEVKEKLQALGIPVFVDMSSYESHPLGRTEWIKLYGVLTGKLDAATKSFKSQAKYAEQDYVETGKTVAFFYINSNGGYAVRRSGDYVSKMIAMAGGEYVFSDIGGDTATATATIDKEKFYAAARNADLLIYNGTIVGEVRSVAEIIAKDSLLKDFKAVKNGDVWCTEKNFYQDSTGLGEALSELNKMLTDENADSLSYFIKLK